VSIQLLEGFAGGTLSVESLKQKAHRFSRAKTKAEEEWQEQTAIVIVQSGEGRMLILESPPTAKFEVRGILGLGVSVRRAV
jgi:hypothetical protein